jgi:hypothetical protein
MREAQEEYGCRVSFVMPAWLADELKATAKANLTSVNSILRKACAEFVKKEPLRRAG